MNVTLTTNVDGLMRKVNALAAAAQDPSKALLRCGGSVRSHSRHAFEQGGPGWAPLAEETIKRKLEASEVAFLKGQTSKVLALSRALNRGRVALAGAKTDRQRTGAEARQKAREDQAQAIELAFSSRRLSSFAAQVKFAERERARKKYHGEQQRQARAAYKAGEITAEEKRKIGARGKRRELVKGHSTGILGDLDKSLGMKLDLRKIWIFSKAKIGGIHNVGGVAGHGAKIKARPFMYIPDGGPALYARIVKEELVGAFVTA